MPTTVKIQFFKTFILPCFDYCLSLVIYFPKYTIQKLANSYYMCLFKLFNFNFNNKDCTYINNFLKRYKLFSFEHRILLRISMFIFKITRSPFGPLLLKNQIIKKNENTVYELRENEKYVIPRIHNHYGEATFSYFVNNLLNNTLKEELKCLTLTDFKAVILYNFESLFIKFIENNPKFQLQYKVYDSFR